MCRPRHTVDGASQNISQRPSDQPLFTIRPLNDSTYLIRENDSYGEHPHIYAKHRISSTGAGVIVLSDIGVGTSHSSSNIWTFLASTINPHHQHPYILILSHCHYDHILGLSHLPATSTFHLTIAASARLPLFTTPHAALQEHSLCTSLDLHAPSYSVDLWLRDAQPLPAPASLPAELELGITALHTPGHTPDSLSFFDAHARVLYVGDSFYAQRSTDSQGAPWGDEGNAPIMFPKEGDLGAWWVSLKRLVELVQKEDERAEVEGTMDRVLLAAGHVSVGVEAYGFMLRARAFMGRVLRGDIQSEELPVKRGREMRWWKEDEQGRVAEFSLVAPLRVVDEGRANIPEDEWR